MTANTPLLLLRHKHAFYAAPYNSSGEYSDCKAGSEYRYRPLMLFLDPCLLQIHKLALAGRRYFKMTATESLLLMPLLQRTIGLLSRLSRQSEEELQTKVSRRCSLLHDCPVPH